MNVKEDAAMTEASGITSDPDTNESMSASRVKLDENAQGRVLSLSDAIRNFTVAAPLTALFIAFLTGWTVARRR
jgi:hypothetical protein